MRKFNKKKLPSRHTSLGPDKAPKDIVEQEKTNFDNLEKDAKKIELILESL